MAGLARRSLATLTTFVLLAGVGFTLGALVGILWEQPRMILTYLTGGTTEIAWRGEGDSEAEVAGEMQAESLPDVAAAPETIAPPAISPNPPARPAEIQKPKTPAPLEPPPTPSPPVVVDRSGPVSAAPSPGKPPTVDESRTLFAPASEKKPERKAEASGAARSAPPTPASGSRRFAIQVGAFAKSESAERLVRRLEGRGYDAYVTPGAGEGNARWRVRVGPVADKGSAEALASELKKNEKLPTWILDEGGG
jgi:cell division septation protein DedD